MNTSTYNYNRSLKIAVIADENNRIQIIDWAYHHKSVLSRHQLVATETISDILEGVLNKPVSRLDSTPLRSPQQLAFMLSEAKLDMIIFLSDPLTPGVYHQDEKALLDLAMSSNLIIAANQTTADFILGSLLLDAAETTPVIPNHDFTTVKSRIA